MIWVLIFLAAIGLGLFLYFKFFKIPKLKNIVFVDGSLGTGKSFYSVSLAIRLYKKVHRQWFVRSMLLKVLRFIPKYADIELEEPVLCSNIYLRNVPFVPLNLDIVTCKVRLPFRSVVLIDEASLLADQMLFKDKKVNEALSIFFKLFRHRHHGGYLILNSQSTSDMHYTLKYVLSDYLYIHSRVKLPFVTLLRVQEMVYSADKDGNTIVNAVHGDIEQTLRLMLVFNGYYKRYDSYCFSTFSDDLPIYRELKEFRKGDSLKSRELVTFRDWEFLKQYNEDRKKDRA